MSPSSGDIARTPEPKSSGGFASVLQSLTGRNKSSKSPNVIPPGAVKVQSANGSANDLRGPVCGGPPDYERLYEQLKIGNPPADRIAAADSICQTVQDYPLSGVC